MAPNLTSAVPMYIASRMNYSPVRSKASVKSFHGKNVSLPKKSGYNSIKPQINGMDKRKMTVADQWLTQKGLTGHQAAVVIFSLVIEYGNFCKENREEPLDQRSFLDLMKSKMVPKCVIGGGGNSGEFTGCSEAMDTTDSGCESSDHDSQDSLETFGNEKKSLLKKSYCDDSSSSYDSGFETNDPETENSSSDDGEKSPILIIDEKKTENETNLSFQKDNNDEKIHQKQQQLAFSNEDEKSEIHLEKKIKTENETTLNFKQKIARNVVLLLNLKEFRGCECYGNASKFAQVLIDMLCNNMLSEFLKMFSHSIICKRQKCSTLCFMFKRIFRHITTSPHKCAVKQVYGHVLRLHLDFCSDSYCRVPKCLESQSKRTMGDKDHVRTNI